MKTLKTLLFLSVLLGAGLFLSLEAQAADWYSPDWGYRKAITVDNSANANALTDYQVLITLNAENFDYAKANADGSDLRFTDATGLTEISYWVKDWSTTTATSSIWVKVPSVPANGTTTVYLYYGNSGAINSTSNFDTTMQKLEVASGTVALWHFDEATGTALVDSSAYANNGTLYNFAPDNSDWVADSASEYGGSGSALNFDGVDNYIEVPHNDSFNFGTGNFTIEGWINIRPDIVIYGNIGCGNIIEKFDWGGISGQGLILDMVGFMVNLVVHTETYSVPDNIFIDAFSEPINPDEWVHIAAVKDGLESVQLYINEQNRTDRVEIEGVQGSIDTLESLKIGKIGQTQPFYGLIDELRISNRALSEQEIKADYERRKYTAIEPTFSAGAEEITPYNASETIVAETGGTVSNTANTVTIDVPAAALATTTDITIEASEETGSFQVQSIEPIDYVYTFGPEGTTFSTSVTIVFNYDDTGMTIEEETGLDVYYYNATTSLWEAQGATVDTALNTLTITVTHFSSFVVGGNVVLKEISGLISLVDEFYEQGKIENQGIAQSLNIQLRNAQRKIREGEIAVAIKMLEHFVMRVEKLSPKLIEPSAAEILIGKANEIIAVLKQWELLRCCRN